MKKFWFVMFVLITLIPVACSNGVSKSADTVSTLAPVPAEYAERTNPLGADAATAGALVFEANCSVCHGSQGHGDGPAGASLDPTPKNLPELSARVGDDYLFWRISEGSQGTAMVAWKGVLTEEEIWQVIAYIRKLK